MEIIFGKHSGTSMELLVLKYPDYVAWLLRKENAVVIVNANLYSVTGKGVIIY